MEYSILLLALLNGVKAIPAPIPQGITAAIAPPSPAPTGCMLSYSGSFGIAVMNITSTGSAPVTQSPDGQPQAATVTKPGPVTQLSDGQPQGGSPTVSVKPVTQISDGQIQATMQSMITIMRPVSMISDGQIQAATKPMMMTMMPVTQISDGQIQAPMRTYMPVSQISDGQPQAPKPTAAPVSQISDGQPQAPKPTAAPVSQISDGQPQAPKSTAAPISQISDGQPQAPKTTAAAVSQIPDGQPQAKTAAGASQLSDGQPQATPAPPSGGVQMVACSSPGTLSLTLNNGVLLDGQGRTGYIAANYQFQFDKPAQTGAIFTSGFSVCSNGSLALGGSAVFYQCLSGDFYNLYDRSWAPQCSPVTISTLNLITCSKRVRFFA